MNRWKKWQRPALGLVAFALVILLLAGFPSVLQGRAAPDSEPPSIVPPSGELTAIDLPLDALAVLQRLEIAYQDEPRNGVWRAAATSEQIAMLKQEGVNYAEMGKVAIFQGGDAKANHPSALSSATCSGSNSGDYTIPYDAGGYTWVYDPIYTNCSGPAMVTNIDIYYDVEHPYADTEVGLVFGSNSPSWSYVTLETFNYCAPSAVALDGPAPASEWHKYVYNITNFNGRPVDQRWDLAAKDFCSGSPVGYIDYWAIWVYYTAAATPTPTATTCPVLSGRVYDGDVGDESSPIQNVTVSLYVSNDSSRQGTLVTSTTTNSSGWYGLNACGNYDYFNIIESNLTGYSSVDATSVDGVKKTADWIQYEGLQGKTLTGNKFWDRGPSTKTPTPTRTHTSTPQATQTPTPTGTPYADLYISKYLYSPTGTVVPGATITYQLSTGSDEQIHTSDSPRIVVTDTLPSKVSFISATSGSGTCTLISSRPPNDIVRCDSDFYGSGAFAVYLDVRVDDDACGLLHNHAGARAAVYDPDLSNNTADLYTQVGSCVTPSPTATQTRTPTRGPSPTSTQTATSGPSPTPTATSQPGGSADLEIAIESTPVASFKPGAKILYTAHVTQHGPSVAASVVITQVLPAGLTLIPAYFPSWCTATPLGPDTLIRCEVGDMPPSSSRWYTFCWATVDEQACGPITTTMTVRSDTPDPNLGNNTAQRTNIIEPCSTNLRVVKTLIDPPGGVAHVGDVVRFKIEVQNTGPVTITGELQDNFLTDEFDFVSATPIQSSHCGNNTNQLLTWQKLTIPAGGTLTFEVRLRTKLPGASATNCAHFVEIPAPGGPSVPGPSSCASVQVRALEGRHFTVTKKFTVPTNHVIQLGGYWATFETKWLNTGTETANEVRLRDYITPSSVSPPFPLQFDWLGPFQTGDWQKRTVIFMPEDVASPAINTAEWTVTWPDGTKETKSASDYLYITDGQAGKGLFISKTLMDPLPTAAISDTVTFHIAITNVTGADLPTVVLWDYPQPPCLTFTGASIPPDSVSLGVWWTLGPLPQGGTIDLDVFFHADAVCPAALNCASTNYMESESNLRISTACETVPILGERPQIAVTKRRLGPTPVFVGDMVQWEIEVENIGTAPLPVVPLHDAYQAAYFDFDSATPSPDTTDLVHGRLDWNDLGSLPPGGKHTVIVRLIAKSPAVGATNCAETHYTVGSSDLVPSDCDTVDIITEGPAIRVEKLYTWPGPGKPMAVGNQAVFSVTVRNAGTIPLSNVVVQDFYDSDCMEFVTAPGMVTQHPAPGTVLWQIPSLAPGASQSWNVVMDAVAPCIPVENCVHASGFGPAGEHVEDHSCAELEIEPPEPQLSVTKRLAGPPQMPTVGSILQFEIVVQNTGNTSMATVPVHDWYDRDCMEFVGAVPSPDWANPATGEIHWDNVGPLGPGDAAVISVFMRAKGICLPAAWNCSRASWEVNGEIQLDAMDCTDVPIGPPRYRIYLPVTMKE